MYHPIFTISNKILKNIGVIEAAREVIDHAPLLPYYEREFRKDALVRTVHHGTHIEGNELNLTQAEKVLEGHDVVDREREIQEVLNYRKAMDPIDASNARAPNIDKEFIFQLHRLTVEKILDEEKSGVFR